MDNGLVTSIGTKVLTVAEYDRFVNFIPIKFRPIFEVNTITGLRYVELQRLHNHEEWYNTVRNQIILPKEAQRKVKQKLVKRTIDKLPATFPYLFKAFLECKNHQHVILGLRTLKDGITKLVLLQMSIPRLLGRQLKVGC